MMTVDEAVRSLGKSIQEDCRYKRYENAKKSNDADAELQQQINEFQLRRMNYHHESEKEQPDAEKLASWEKELDSMYNGILEHPGMKEFQEAKLELDAMMQEVDAIISLCLNGEDPETCHPSLGGCSGNCASCGGSCH
ncbi:MAG: YlbF family regulator [Ruminococcus sp.]|nr:YlbF family regulator [Ruminococcus sp.]